MPLPPAAAHFFLLRKEIEHKYPPTSHVGAYRIRPNASTNPRGYFQGVCDTPLQTNWQDANIHKKKNIFFFFRIITVYRNILYLCPDYRYRFIPKQKRPEMKTKLYTQGMFSRLSRRGNSFACFFSSLYAYVLSIIKVYNLHIISRLLPPPNSNRTYYALINTQMRCYIVPGGIRSTSLCPYAACAVLRDSSKLKNSKAQYV